MADVREHEWMSLSEAGRYANVSPELLRGAIIAGELEAHLKPPTRGRKEGATRSNVMMRINRGDIDRYIRTFWPLVTARDFGMAAPAGETRRG